MTDRIKRVTPREIVDMVMNAEVHGDTEFVLATTHDAEIERLRARVAELEYAYSKAMAALANKYTTICSRSGAAMAAIANIQQDAQEVAPP